MSETREESPNAPTDLVAVLIAALDREIERARAIVAECDRLVAEVCSGRDEQAEGG